MRRVFKELLKTPGWGRLADYAQGQVVARQNAAVQPSGGLDGCIEQEFSKGEVSGIQLFMAFPGLILEDVDEQISDLIEEIKNDDSSAAAK